LCLCYNLFMSRRFSGFALPSVLIASIIMLDVLLVSVMSTAAVRISLTSQMNGQLAQTAGEAGSAYAQACLDANNGVAQWSNEKPLKPDTDCYGDPLDTGICPADPTNACHFVSVNDGGNTTFSIGLEEEPAINGMKKVVSSESHTCGISSNDLAYCWGSNISGVLGDGTTTDSRIPVAVDTSGALAGKTILDISTYNNHTCVIASDNNAYCWGANTYGQLGNNSRISSSIPVAVKNDGALSGLTVKSISAGYSHTCVIASDNKPYCWGYNRYGQLGRSAKILPSYDPYTSVTDSTKSSNFPVAVFASQAPFNTLNALSITAGYYHTCAIASDNYAYCWGYNNYGQLGVNSTSTAYTPVAVDRTTAPAVLSGKTVTQISAGFYHTCAITFDNVAACWGLGGNGQLGDNGTSNSSIPVAVIRTSPTAMSTTYTVRQISAGKYHSCVVADSTVFCWGNNNTYGRLGNNSTSQYAYPVRVYNGAGDAVLDGQQVNSISASSDHNCVSANTQSYCWGNNDVYGKLGNNSNGVSLIPVAVNITGVTVKNIVASGTTNLTRESDGSVWRNYSQTTRMNLTELSELNELTLQTVSTGNFHTCALSSGNLAYCWGSNANGQLGNGTLNNQLSPKSIDMTGVLNGLTVSKISSGRYHTCAIANGAAYCWGYNNYGQLGDNSTTQRTSPVAVNVAGVLSGKTITQIGAGDYHSCALTSDNIMACWGNNANGQLGDSSTNTSYVPVAVNTSGVLSGKTISSISVGSFHTCVVADAQPYCWGYNANGQIGNGTTTNPTTSPAAVTTSGVLSGRTVTAVAAGYYHTCAIADNLAFCWGSDTNGKLGDSAATSSSTTPVAVDVSGVLSGRSVSHITAAIQTTCVVADNLAFCWGRNNLGQFGDDTTTSSGVPVATSTSGYLANKTLLAVDIRNEHGCATSSETKIYCWGWNDGRLGTNSTDTSFVPFPVYTKGISYIPVGY
jgi:alpha-tubulin suppressor-like RCC1 family protein